MEWILFAKINADSNYFKINNQQKMSRFSVEKGEKQQQHRFKFGIMSENETTKTYKF